MTRLLALLALLFVAAACTVPAQPDAPAGPQPTTTATATPPLPVAFSIPSIEAASSLISTGFLPDGSPEVPPVTEPGQASWLHESVPPGQPGTAVIYGHVDGQVNGKKGQPGVFVRLHQLRPGDKIFVDRLHAAPVAFRVDRIATYPKSEFDPNKDGSVSAATHEVYDDTAAPSLRLVTCGGDFDESKHSYRDQIVAFASEEPQP